MANVVKYEPIGDINLQGGILMDALTASNVPNAATGKKTLFLDVADTTLKTKDSSGTVAQVGGSSAGLTVEEVTTATTIATGKLYIANSSSNIDFTLPATFAQGFTFGILAKGTGGWTIKSGAASQVIKGLSQSSVVAVASGTRLQAQSVQYGYAEYVATTANTILTMITDESSDFFPSEYGYGGGRNGNISNLSFSSESSSVVAALVTAKGNTTGFNSSDDGFVAGGYLGGSSATDAIEKFNFIAQSSSAISAVLEQASYGKGAVNSTTKGYLAGSSIGALDVQALTFSTLARSVLSASLSYDGFYNSSYNSSTNGYYAGGYNNLRHIQKLNFTGETMSLLSNILTRNEDRADGVNSTTAGYSMGGCDGQNAISKTLFSTDTYSVLSATLGTAREYGAGVNSSTKGYMLSGTGGTGLIDALVFSSETNSTIATMLAGASDNVIGFQSGGIL
jgi:hypothetical protein